MPPSRSTKAAHVQAVIVADAIMSARREPLRRISYSRRKGWWTGSSRYRGREFTHDTVVPAVDALIAAGILVDHDLQPRRTGDRGSVELSARSLACGCQHGETPSEAGRTNPVEGLCRFSRCIPGHRTDASGAQVGGESEPADRRGRNFTDCTGRPFRWRRDPVRGAFGVSGQAVPVPGVQWWLGPQPTTSSSVPPDRVKPFRQSSA